MTTACYARPYGRFMKRQSNLSSTTFAISIDVVTTVKKAPAFVTMVTMISLMAYINKTARKD